MGDASFYVYVQQPSSRTAARERDIWKCTAVDATLDEVSSGNFLADLDAPHVLLEAPVVRPPRSFLENATAVLIFVVGIAVCFLCCACCVACAQESRLRKRSLSPSDVSAGTLVHTVVDATDVRQANPPDLEVTADDIIAQQTLPLKTKARRDVADDELVWHKSRKSSKEQGPNLQML